MAPDIVFENPDAGEYDSQERRRSSQHGCEGRAEIFAFELGSLICGMIQTISQHGCYVLTSAPLRLKHDSEVDLSFVVNNHSYQVGARVMNIQPGKGIDLEFLSGETRTEEAIRKLIGTLGGTAASSNPQASTPAQA